MTLTAHQVRGLHALVGREQRRLPFLPAVQIGLSGRTRRLPARAPVAQPLVLNRAHHLGGRSCARVPHVTTPRLLREEQRIEVAESIVVLANPAQPTAAPLLPRAPHATSHPVLHAITQRVPMRELGVVVPAAEVIGERLPRAVLHGAERGEAARPSLGQQLVRLPLASVHEEMVPGAQQGLETRAELGKDKDARAAHPFIPALLFLQSKPRRIGEVRGPQIAP